MAKAKIKPIECGRIIERHLALGRTEVALSRQNGDMLAVELITANEDGTHDRRLISGLFPSSALRKLRTRLMDFHAGVVSAQRALGMSYNPNFA